MLIKKILDSSSTYSWREQSSVNFHLLNPHFVTQEPPRPSSQFHQSTPPSSTATPAALALQIISNKYVARFQIDDVDCYRTVQLFLQIALISQHFCHRRKKLFLFYQVCTSPIYIRVHSLRVWMEISVFNLAQSRQKILGVLFWINTIHIRRMRNALQLLAIRNCLHGSMSHHS